MEPRLQIPGLQVFERGWLSANNILLTDGFSATLIDSGYVTHQAQTLALVQNTLKDRPLDRLVNTHLHSDHCGGNHQLQLHYPELQTLIPPGEARAVSVWDAEALSYEATGQLCPQFKFDAVLQAGQVLRMACLDWEVHAAPGHDPHSVILFEPTHKILISADALWANGFGVVFPELEGVAAFHEVDQTLNLIETLNPSWVIPGHGSVFNQVDEALSVARKKLEGFVKDPEKHARYGAKVLLKYKLLELIQTENTAFVAWASDVPYLKILHQTYSAQMTLQEWIQNLLRDLERSKALAYQNTLLVNL
jgi:glyoxylase-like metal-dependent hydrolase (beta-lactamase superfamily II)